MSFEPERVTTLIVPVEVSSVERSRFDWPTWNSPMAICGMFCVVVPTVSSLISIPSTSIRAVLNLNTRLELSEIKKVPPVDREILNLLRSEHALYRRLFGIHGNRRALHGDDCSF